MACQFQHIVYVATFTGITREVIRNVIRFEKTFLITITARHKTMMVNNSVPEKRRDGIARTLSFNFIITTQAY